MIRIQLILSAIVYFLCCSVVLASLEVKLIELFQAQDIIAALFLAIIFIPLLVAVFFVLARERAKSMEISAMVLTIMSIGLIYLNYSFPNLRSLNQAVPVVAVWSSGMPKTIKYYEYGDHKQLVELHYHENGNIARRTNYWNGRKSGLEYTFNQNSTLKQIRDYVEDFLISEYNFEDIDKQIMEGMLDAELFFKALERNQPTPLPPFEQFQSLSNPCGYPNYTLTQFHDNGKPKTTQSFVNDKEYGAYIEYNERGHIIVEGEKHGHDRVGLWTYYDERGEIKLIEAYEYPELKEGE